MHVHVKMVGAVKSLVERSDYTVSISTGDTVDDVIKRVFMEDNSLKIYFDSVESFQEQSFRAVNGRIITKNQVVNDCDSIMLSLLMGGG